MTFLVTYRPTLFSYFRMSEYVDQYFYCCLFVYLFQGDCF